MTNIDIIKSKIREIEKYIDLVKELRKYSKKQAKKDTTLQGAIERYLFLLCQSTIDCGEAIISYLKLRVPSTYGEIFEILKEKKIISNNLALDMEKMAGFRNILTRLYGKTDFDIVYEVLTNDVEKFEMFIISIRKKLDI